MLNPHNKNKQNSPNLHTTIKTISLTKYPKKLGRFLVLFREF